MPHISTITFGKLFWILCFILLSIWSFYSRVKIHRYIFRSMLESSFSQIFFRIAFWNNFESLQLFWKKDSIAGITLWILRDFSEKLFFAIFSLANENFISKNLSGFISIFKLNFGVWLEFWIESCSFCQTIHHFEMF